MTHTTFVITCILIALLACVGTVVAALLFEGMQSPQQERKGRRRLFRRPPDIIIGTADNPYLYRWHLIPRNRLCNIYLHKFLRSDDDRALHDHPWPSCSIILKGGYVEHLPGGITKTCEAGRITFRKAHQAHRVELIPDFRGLGPLLSKRLPMSSCILLLKEFGKIETIKNSDLWPKPRPCWTLFITGPKVREWGFHCPKGWRHWRDFCGVPTGEARGDEIGKGCE